MQRMRLFLVAVIALAASVGLAAPASAQQEGLVNLALTDGHVQVPVAVAANVCDVNANVLATQDRLGGATCDADATSLATNGPGGGGGTPGQGGTPQDGLINVFIDDVNVQVPISVAANVCDVNVNVLARQLRLGGAQCDADAPVDATRSPGNSGA